MNTEDKVEMYTTCGPPDSKYIGFVIVHGDLDNQARLLQNLRFLKKNAKGTTNPRVEFILPKKLLEVISQVQTQILIKFLLHNIDQALI